MKHFFFIAAVLSAISLQAQPDYSGLANAMRSGNAAAVSGFLDNNTLIQIPGTDDMLSRDAATSTLAAFFAKNRPASCDIANKGNSNGSSYYAIGNLSAGGRNYRVYVFAKANGAAPLVQELKLEAQ